VGWRVAGLRLDQRSERIDRRTHYGFVESAYTAPGTERTLSLDPSRRCRLARGSRHSGEGLFGAEEAIDLPERAHRGLGVLGELRALIAGVLDVATDANKAASVGDIKGTLRQMREMTRIAEHEMHEVILSCKRARRDMLVSLPARKPTLH
jgi:hypothetical protein